MADDQEAAPNGKSWRRNELVPKELAPKELVLVPKELAGSGTGRAGTDGRDGCSDLKPIWKGDDDDQEAARMIRGNRKRAAMRPMVVAMQRATPCRPVHETAAKFVFQTVGSLQVAVSFIATAFY